MAARGEGTIELENGEEVSILFTNKALAAAEKQMGKGVLGVVNGFMGGTSGIGDLAYLLQAGMEASRRDGRMGGRSVTLNDAYEVLDAVGFTDVVTVVMDAVAAVISYSTSNDEVAADGPKK